MKKISPLLVLSVMATSLFGQKADVMLPSEMKREQLIHHNAFSLSYSTAYVMPSWVAYKVDNKTVNKAEMIKGKYQPDPNITARAATKKDYKDSGYLMGQFVNYLDVMSKENAATESFYMTNIAPMKQAFYKHMWLKTEDLVRLWAKDSEGFYIFCGPINKDAPFPTFGKNKVSVPKRYYKIIYDAKNQQAIAFLFKNGVSSGSLKSYSHSIAEIETETGINFLPKLDDATAEKVKNNVDYDYWKFEIEGIKY